MTEKRRMIEYTELVRAAYKDGAIANCKAVLVHEGEPFSFKQDNDVVELHHTPDPFGEAERKLLGAYVVTELANGRLQYEMMAKHEIDAAKAESNQTGPKSPWAKWYGEMAKKTVVKRAAKMWPESPLLSALIDRDNEEYRGKGNGKIDELKAAYGGDFPVAAPKTPKGAPLPVGYAPSSEPPEGGPAPPEAVASPPGKTRDELVAEGRIPTASWGVPRRSAPTGSPSEPAAAEATGSPDEPPHPVEGAEDAEVIAMAKALGGRVIEEPVAAPVEPTDGVEELAAKDGISVGKAGRLWAIAIKGHDKGAYAAIGAALDSEDISYAGVRLGKDSLTKLIHWKKYDAVVAHVEQSAPKDTDNAPQPPAEESQQGDIPF